MKNLVVAYSSADERPAQIVIGKLQKLGYRVTPQTASRRIMARSRAKTSTAPVVLLWSRNFARSATPSSAIATLRLDAAPPPARLKAPSIDLRQWRGREDHRGWRKLVTTLGGGKAAKAVKAPIAAPAAKMSSAFTPTPIESEAPKKSSPLGAILFLLLLAIGGGGAAYWYFMMR
jgi:hypothetical protein